MLPLPTTFPLDQLHHVKAIAGFSRLRQHQPRISILNVVGRRANSAWAWVRVGAGLDGVRQARGADRVHHPCHPRFPKARMAHFHLMILLVQNISRSGARDGGLGKQVRSTRVCIAPAAFRLI